MRDVRYAPWFPPAGFGANDLVGVVGSILIIGSRIALVLIVRIGLILALILALIIRIVDLAAGGTAQTPPPGRALPTHPRVAPSPPLHPVRTRSRVEAVQFGVAALFEACLEGEGTGGTGGDEDVAHLSLECM